jgi:hypothetical protein
MIVLLFIFIVPMYVHQEVLTAHGFAPKMPLPAFGSVSGDYVDLGGGSDMSGLLPRNGLANYTYDAKWQPGPSVYLYMGSIVLTISSFLLLKAYIRKTAPRKSRTPVVPIEASQDKAAQQDEELTEAVVAIEDDLDDGVLAMEAVQVEEEVQDGDAIVPAATGPGPVEGMPPLETAPPTAIHAEALDEVLTKSGGALEMTLTPENGAGIGEGPYHAPEEDVATQMRTSNEDVGSVTIIEVRDRRALPREHLSIEGEKSIIVECPECKNLIEALEADEHIICDRCGFEGRK